MFIVIVDGFAIESAASKDYKKHDIRQREEPVYPEEAIKGSKCTGF